MIRKATVLLFSLVFIPALMMGQSNDQKSFPLSFEAKGLVLFPSFNDTDSDYNTDFEREDNTHIIGVDFESNYFFNDTFGVGVGLGYEKVNQPNFDYIPIYLNLIGNFDDLFYGNLQFGIHEGCVDNPGFLFRAGLGYRLKVSHLLQINFVLVYAFQNIYKSFKDSGRPENYYNFESVGLAISVKIN